ncbi:MAG: DUF2232 domain-containing protein [Monoglobales bacterium]
MNILKLTLFFILSTLSVALLPESFILMPVLLIFSAALYVAISAKWSFLYSVFSAAFAGIIIYFMQINSMTFSAAVTAAVIFPSLSLLSALGIYFALRQKSSVKTAVLSGMMVYLALLALAYFFYGRTFISDIINIFEDSTADSIKAMSESLPAGTDPSIVEYLNKATGLYFENLRILAPSILLSTFSLISYFTLKTGNRLVRGNEIFTHVPSFSEIHAPFFLSVIAVASHFAQTSNSAFVSGLSANLFMLLSVLFTLCGFSLIDFFLKRRVKPVIARAVIYLLGIIFFSILSLYFYLLNPILIAMFLGILDSLFNYRLKIRIFGGK